ncbi:hypothetical protein M2114_001015 [Aurantimicrobium minutum]|jgi:hypothetical protein|uniref:hypothetical protein n=1 Tax=Aurantimicrobium minutum TaxID=708131 RepID=UPI0024745BEF|nr:hypothetical protein [Aurantimicrobium minutum]MDH6424898.1 hypothetical protein [Aurantimicrobium minutum]
MKTSHKAILSLSVASIAVLTLAGCDQIPSLDVNDQAANKAACEAVGKTWDTLNSALSSGDIAGLPLAFINVPGQLDSVLSQAKDKQLTEALAELKKNAQSVVDGNQPDVAGFIASGVGISARCAILGATVNLELPQLP